MFNTQAACIYCVTVFLDETSFDVYFKTWTKLYSTSSHMKASGCQGTHLVLNQHSVTYDLKIISLSHLDSSLTGRLLQQKLHYVN